MDGGTIAPAIRTQRVMKVENPYEKYHRAHVVSDIHAGPLAGFLRQPAAGHGDQVVGPPAQFLTDVVDQKVDAAAFSHNPRQRLAADRLARGENGGLDTVHPFAPAHVRRQVIQLPIKQLVS